MKKRIIIISIILLVGLLLSCCFLFLRNFNKPKTFSTAKEVCKEVLTKNQTEMENIAINSLNKGEKNTGNYKEYFYSCDFEKKTVSFDIGSQGMLGGQYWNLVYSENGTLYGETESYFCQEESGNNIIKAEKINDNWWFYWIDYDGTEKTHK